MCQGLPLIKQFMVGENETCSKISAIVISTLANLDDEGPRRKIRRTGFIVVVLSSKNSSFKDALINGRR